MKVKKHVYLCITYKMKSTNQTTYGIKNIWKSHKIYANFQNNFWIQNFHSSLCNLCLGYIISSLVCKLSKQLSEISANNVEIQSRIFICKCKIVKPSDLMVLFSKNNLQYTFTFAKAILFYILQSAEHFL